MMTNKIDITLDINAQQYEVSVEPRQTLVDVIRQDCGLSGTHVGCEQGVCGSCTIIIDGVAIRSCLMFAVQAQGKEIKTIEGMAKDGHLHPIQRAFTENHALQCGFCTPGFIMLIQAYLDEHAAPTDDEIVELLSSNLCRCTGYQNIIKAVKQLVRQTSEK
ncbi:MAG: carbon-monoxide dehydrogenase small subunit [Gammaproteobacteria bacterium]|jgi:carbon-monoxide dehydrogenase small subunit